MPGHSNDNPFRELALGKLAAPCKVIHIFAFRYFLVGTLGYQINVSTLRNNVTHLIINHYFDNESFILHPGYKKTWMITTLLLCCMLCPVYI
jgi:hypothetical protein